MHQSCWWWYLYPKQWWES